MLQQIHLFVSSFTYPTTAAMMPRVYHRPHIRFNKHLPVPFKGQERKVSQPMENYLLIDEKKKKKGLET